MSVPLAGVKNYGEDKLLLYYPVMKTSPAFPQAGDSYLSNVGIKDIDIKSVYLEKGNMSPNLDYEGEKYEWATGITEIQSDFVDLGASMAGASNLLYGTDLTLKQWDSWHEIYEDPTNTPSSWHYGDKEPSDKKKIWVNTKEKGFKPLLWAEAKWQDYYSVMKKRTGNLVEIINQKKGNSFQITKEGNFLSGFGQYTRLKESVKNRGKVTVGLDFEEVSKSEGIFIRVEFYDQNGQWLMEEISPRFFNKTLGEKIRKSHTFGFRDSQGREAKYVRVSVLGVPEDRYVKAAVNRIKLEHGEVSTAWTLHETEVSLDLNAGEIPLPMLNGVPDKSKIILEIAVLRSALGEGLLKWEEVTRIKASSMREAVLYDYFIENGNYYRYALQPILANGVKGAITTFYDTVTTLEGFWMLGEGDMQFSFIYDGKIGEITHRRSDTVIETLTSQYPYVIRPSDIDYRTFSFTGKFTYHQDVHKLLISDTYTEAISPDPTVPIGFVELKYGDEMKLNCQNDLDMEQDGMVMQRVWREKILKWMKNGKPKILKSESEGNILVAIKDVNVTPVESLYGLVADFSCTMIEIGKVDEKTLQRFKLRKDVLTKDDLIKASIDNNAITR